MLTELHINNFAIIDNLRVPFARGLNVITGETGAGKSIIVQALGMILGDRVSQDVVRSGEKEAEVTALFDISKVSFELGKNLAQLGIEGENILTLKRSVSVTGRSKAFIHGRPVSASELKSISSLFLEIASQHEHQRLLEENSHLDIVDKFGDVAVLMGKYKCCYDEFMSIRNKLAELKKLSASKEEQSEFLEFQIEEIKAASLTFGEDEELARERNIIKHAADLYEKLNSAAEILYSSEGSIGAGLDKMSDILREVAAVDSSTGEWSKLADQAIAGVSELTRNIESYLGKLDVDPGRLEEIESRLYEVQRLKKKYNGSIEEILEKKKEFERRLSLMENCEGELEKLEEDEKKAKRLLEKAADSLSVRRSEASLKLSTLIQKELETLGLKKTTFAPGHVRLGLNDADEKGVDRFSFLLSPNPGEPLKPLARIASGGELSRIMLAIKNVLLGKVGLTALEVFDEIDVGIGGANAEIVGSKLKEMSAVRQIISITHLPQVACFADQHIVVSKETKGKRTVTRFSVLPSNGRVDEIARMLGGLKITNTTKEHAREMLERGSGL